jgi:glycosyltransferase involved in cell wall biosynthesis
MTTTSETRPPGERAPSGRPTTVSVVIPCRDDAVLLRRCLESLAAQTSPPDEIVVVDNASSDDTAAVARAAGARVVVEPVPGVSAASAAGYDSATGDVVARLDADCEAPVDWIARVRERFDLDPDLVALTGGARFTDGPVLLRRVGAALYLGAYVVAVSLALGHVPLFGSNCAFRRDDWLRVRGAVHRDDALMHDDIDLSYHLGPEARIRYDHRLGMRVSARPFRTGDFSVRLRRGFHSVYAHWPEEHPRRRVARRLRAVVRRRLGTSGVADQRGVQLR